LLPVIAPRSWVGVPSPQFTVTSRIGLGFVVAGVTTNVNVAGTPALSGVVGGVIVRDGAPATLTITLPEAWPELAGVVPPPVVGGVVDGGVVVDEPPCAPTVPVTVAVVLVVNTVLATPLVFVLTRF
jgi:hypothetical protein